MQHLSKYKNSYPTEKFSITFLKMYLQMLQPCFAWCVLQSGLYGHSAVYHEQTDAIYVFGGYRFHVETVEPSGELYSLYYPNLTWSLLVPSQGNKVIGWPHLDKPSINPLSVHCINTFTLSVSSLCHAAPIPFLPCCSPDQRHHGYCRGEDRSRGLQ